MGKIRYGTAAGVTAQQIFNKVWKHFIVNKAPRGIIIEGGVERCVYRTESGAACAVGVCLRNDEVPAYNFRPDTSWLPTHLRKHVDFLIELQAAHDGYGGWSYRDAHGPAQDGDRVPTCRKEVRSSGACVSAARTERLVKEARKRILEHIQRASAGQAPVPGVDPNLAHLGTAVGALIAHMAHLEVSLAETDRVLEEVLTILASNENAPDPGPTTKH
jgi:hypothetical protein